uniref:Uncharacterized protein n=1 Tax=Bionectria ochroleuca TaxID=29856 RepID=A0A8H7NB51_BIOOC
MDLVARTVGNDTRGWILCIISGIACLFGASIICVDAIVRLFPGKRNFRIEESNVFLACSLSLSFGVMLFSSLYSMLPESKRYLINDGWADRTAGLIMMACFVGGFFGIQIISRLLHQYISFSSLGAIIPTRVLRLARNVPVAIAIAMVMAIATIIVIAGEACSATDLPMRMNTRPLKTAPQSLPPSLPLF